MHPSPPTQRHGRGMILGKFMPPHLGHVYLGEFARSFVEDLTIVVGSLEREPIPGELRCAWMRELFPDARVVHLTDELPQEPREHPDFWRLWREALVRVLPSAPDFVFASENYGVRLASELGSSFVPVDLARSVMPVSGTAVRSNPFANWEYLPRCVRPYFVRRVCVFGPESTGKSTLARALARHLGTVFVPEYARTLLEARDGRVVLEDMETIARGQIASEEALARSATRWLVCDTDVLTTALWSDALFGTCASWITDEANRRPYDLYLLTDIDLPFAPDPVRYLPHERERFFARCEEALCVRNRPYVRIRGSGEARTAAAVAAVNAIVTRAG